MSNSKEVMIIVEGKTEQLFIENILAPYFAPKGIYLKATQITKKGQKGGDVRFSRAKTDIRNHLRQRADTFVSIFVDYYGIKEWPGLDSVPDNATPEQIAEHLNTKVKQAILTEFPDSNSAVRFIPFLAVHEFETLLFSDTAVLAAELGIKKTTIDKVISECGSPERINNSPETAPAKRLENWSKGHYGKTSTGIAIAGKVGIMKMREQCPLFNAWLNSLEHVK